MSSWKDRVYCASRSQRFLWKFAIGTLVLGFSVGMVLSWIDPSGAWALGDRTLAAAGLQAQADEPGAELPESSPELPALLEAELAEASINFYHLVRAIPTLAPYLAKIDQGEIRRIFCTRFSEQEAALATDYLAGWNEPASGASDRIEAAANASPQRYAHYILGRLELRRKNHRAAYEHFRREATADGAIESRWMAVWALAETDDFKTLAQMESDPLFAPYFDAHTKLRIASAQKDWRGILRAVLLTQLESYRQGVFLVALVAGLAWALFLLNLGEIPRVLCSRTALCGFGFLAGVLSTTATIYLVVIQDDILKHNAGDTVYHALAYFIAGVGLREELCKLLLFVPFLPVLLKRDNELEALLVASFVGLGFAIEENGNYYMMSEAASAPGRFLTANFFHIALTGMNGLFLFRACRWGWAGLNQFLFVFPLTIVVHGVYDALLDTREIEGGGYWAMAVYVAFCQYYFRSLNPLRSNGRRTVSLTGSFVFGTSILGATVIAFQMATLGAGAGATLIFSELLSSAVLLFLFFREMHEPLTP